MKKPALFPVIWLTGNTGAGKSTLAFAMRELFNSRAPLDHPLSRRIIVLDGDEMRASISVDEGLSPEDRRRHNLRVARLAKLLHEAGNLVIVAVIAPFERVRSETNAICSPLWVYIKRSGLEAHDRPYEPPVSPDAIIDNDTLGIEAAQEQLRQFLESVSSGSAKEESQLHTALTASSR